MKKFLECIGVELVRYGAEENRNNRLDILDGLRGVAAFCVAFMHFLSMYSKHAFTHGYLGVDFFFLLSGFVLSYSYDNRWDVLNFKDFMKRRVIRLHPMLVFSALSGFIWFYFGFTGKSWPPLRSVVIVVILQCLLIPCPRFLNVRGWKLMFPLNNSIWSLFWEYIGSVLYALVFRKLSNILLKVCVCIALLATVLYGLNINVLIALHDPTTSAYGFDSGFRNDYYHHIGAFIRLAFPFLFGILLSRKRTFIRMTHAQIICPVIMCILLCVPDIKCVSGILNSIYEMMCIIVIFPVLLLVGAGSSVNEKWQPLFRFIGDISYPFYTIHLSIVNVIGSWKNCKNNIASSVYFCAVFSMILLSIWIAYSALKLYDEPIRRFLKKKLDKKEHLQSRQLADA